METQVGIDVGGTFTDAVLICENRIIQKAKVPTHPENLLETLLHALESLGAFQESVHHISVSTTLVTNSIVQNKLPPVELFLFPGSGMKLEALGWPVHYHELKGEVDYRGREVNPPDELEWRRILNQHDFGTLSRIAIVSKFSHRNKVLEESLASYLSKRYPQLDLALGHEWGQSNFFRRSLTTYLNLATSRLFSEFAMQLQQAVTAKGSKAVISILKADGGVLPLKTVRPIESIYSGPAASVLGTLAQTAPGQSFIVVDIGGTTTDIGLVLSGEPLMSARGAKIGSFSTLVRTLSVRSISVGGDTTILPTEEGFEIAPYRTGPAYCLGGKAPTPTDAMRYLGHISYGEFTLAEEGLATLLPYEARNPASLKRLAESILEKVTEKIVNAIEGLQSEWNEEPAYKVWEVLHPRSHSGFDIWVSGGSAKGISSSLEKRLPNPVRYSKHYEVSNAIGAALAQPTFSCTLHLDTSIRRYRIEETGEQGEWFGSRRPHKEVEGFLQGIASRRAQEIGLEFDKIRSTIQQPFDFFPVVKGYETVGQIIRGSYIVPPGVVGRVKE
jgi:N-methylhydantoinase A